MTDKNNIQKLATLMSCCPVARSIATKYVGIETELNKLSKMHDIPIENLWAKFNRKHTASVYDSSVIIEEIKNELQIEQGRK
jgi:hypothetical protein